jgi:hypothetical protein
MYDVGDADRAVFEPYFAELVSPVDPPDASVAVCSGVVDDNVP